MKIASWNVNSLRVRLPQVLKWLAMQNPDVLALQELKQVDAAFPVAAFTELGYQAVFSGQKTYNGVAVLAREDCTQVETTFPHFPDEQKRLLATTIGDIRLINIYVPNGQSVGSDKYEYKLLWLTHLYEYLQQALSQYPKVVVVGDFNIAPQDADVYEPLLWQDSVLCSPAERLALQKIFSLGFVDCFRLFSQPPQTFSWWDYRTFAFQGNRGLRIDLMLANSQMASSVDKCWVDIAPRAWLQPSDHAPVVLTCG